MIEPAKPQTILEPCAAPSAPVARYETSHDVLWPGVIVERYTTGNGALFEKHNSSDGAVAWYRVVKASDDSGQASH